MIFFKRALSLVSIFVAVFICSNFFARADSITPDTFDVGGGVSSGGGYILNSSLGQFDSGISSGGGDQINAGYEQEFVSGSYINIAVDPTGDISMSSISGFMSGQIGSGSADITVTTDYSGYDLAIKASTNPALKCDVSSGCDPGDAFDNYTPSAGAGTPDYEWSVGESASEFGFTAKGDDILGKFKFDTLGGSCGSGSYSITGEYCWDALTTSDINIASSSISNDPSGTTTKVKFRSQVGANKLQPSGGYKAAIIVTATASS